MVGDQHRGRRVRVGGQVATAGATRSSRPPRSSPAAGSSSSSSSGSVISARAICTRLRSPSLSVPNGGRRARPRRTGPEQRRPGPVVGRRSAPASARPPRTRRRPRRRHVARPAGSAGPAPRWSARSAAAARTRRPRRAARRAAATVPRVGCSCAAASCSSVVLPAPFGPSTTQRSSSSTVQSTRAQQVRLPAPHVDVLPSGGHVGSLRHAAHPTNRGSATAAPGRATVARDRPAVTRDGPAGQDARR